MIIVMASVTARDDSRDEILKLGQAHVDRSRTEPGCISHAMHIHCENPLRLVFFEQWADRDALLTHFAVPETLQSMRALQTLAAGPPDLKIFDARQIEKP